MVQKTLVKTVHEVVEEELFRLRFFVVVATEAGNTRRSDGELVGQFISSCRLAGRRVRHRHTHTTHTRALTTPTSNRRKKENRNDRGREKWYHTQPNFSFFFSVSYYAALNKKKKKKRIYGKG
jgi:hypothetical protein